MILPVSLNLEWRAYRNAASLQGWKFKFLSDVFHIIPVVDLVLQNGSLHEVLKSFICTDML